ncbi:MAG: hypothetical protein M3Q87_02295 [Actinomycetota bacterium]|nr:hypothetical protein [Actinomycetota bacterium]
MSNAWCSCGQPYPQCEYWRRLDIACSERGRAADGSVRPSQLLRRLLEGWPGLLLPTFVLRRLVSRAGFSERYPAVAFDLGVRLLAELSAGEMVDVSKTARGSANRPRMLHASGLGVELVLAWRPLHDVVASYESAHLRRGRSVARWRAFATVAAGRWASTIAARRCARSTGADLRSSTLEQTIRSADRMAVIGDRGHMIAGNRSRHSIPRRGAVDVG